MHVIISSRKEKHFGSKVRLEDWIKHYEEIKNMGGLAIYDYLTSKNIEIKTTRELYKKKLKESKNKNLGNKKLLNRFHYLVVLLLFTLCMAYIVISNKSMDEYQDDNDDDDDDDDFFD